MEIKMELTKYIGQSLTYCGVFACFYSTINENHTSNPRL